MQYCHEFTHILNVFKYSVFCNKVFNFVIQVPKSVKCLQVSVPQCIFTHLIILAILWQPAFKMAPWHSHSCVVPLCTEEPLGHCGDDGALLLRLGHRRNFSLHFVLSDHLLWGQPAMLWGCSSTPVEGPPANSQHSPASPVGLLGSWFCSLGQVFKQMKHWMTSDCNLIRDSELEPTG